ncbi:MAG TPA: hypothetical protein VED01_28480 [Burkholderiales bacterium]|nr:hypothetical protein [Burkholderiales bacterium]
MRDGIFFTRAGLPTLVFVHDFFERAARAQAKALDMPDLNIYVYPQHKLGDYDAEEAAKGVQAARDLPPLLGGGSDS